ncbi:probable uracil-DNA glycosylase [Cephalotrichum gorgonifer]|uniref:Uracil-DNA glycosylase n=1 Tax=Cephalotrichum gorgonifer TaxID=2041049 RepID=A0AAE8MZ23_9PEZI|nr:probable uracil-DNA glycosylase [Cephalotrichum gorgonifer]
MSTLKRKAATNGSSPDAKKPKQNGNLMSFFTAPKGAPATPAAPPKFDKEKWVAGLTAEQRSLLKLEIDTMDESWLAVLKDDIVTKEFLELKKFLDREENAGKKVFPPREDIYSWSRHTPFHTVKVVIIGQDPYHNHNQAHGLAFSVRPPTPAPPSLKNMYIALKNDYPDFKPPPNRAGLLTPWADRGVLLLNTCLTVRAHDAKSHANRGWERLTQRIIDIVAARRTRGVVYMAWGTPAGMVAKKVDTTKHLVLKSVHPSPLSASRGFFTCGHFKKANQWLVEKYGPGSEIDWDLSPQAKKVEAEVEEKKIDEKKVEVKEVEVKKVEAKKDEDVDEDDLLTEEELASIENATAANLAKEAVKVKEGKVEAKADVDAKTSNKENVEA